VIIIRINICFTELIAASKKVFHRILVQFFANEKYSKSKQQVFDYEKNTLEFLQYN